MTSGATTRRAETILVIDDEASVARMLQKLLVAAGYMVPEVITSPDQLERALETVRPDMVLLDIDLGQGVTGIQLAARIPAHIAVVFCSAHTDEETLALASERRPAGFVVKPAESRQLAAAVQMALAGRGSSSGAPPRALPDLLQLAALSTREREVLEQLISHKRVPAIARALFISPHTVRNHLKSIFTKLEVRSQQELLDLLTRITAPGSR